MAAVFSQLFAHPLFITDPTVQSQMLVQTNWGKGGVRYPVGTMNSTPLVLKLEGECYCTWKQKDLFRIDKSSSYMQRNVPIALGNGTKQRARYPQAALLALSSRFWFLLTLASSKPEGWRCSICCRHLLRKDQYQSFTGYGGE